MEIHKPKSWHGLREFLKEYGIIVLGVLTALGAEQIVEALHNRHVASEAREAIRSELTFSLDRIRARLSISDCVQHRIDEIQAIADGAAVNPRIVTPSWVGRPQYWTLPRVRWEAANQSGRAALMSPDEVADYGFMYSQMQNFFAMETDEQAQWARLRGLEHLRGLSHDDIFALVETLQQARYDNWRIGVAAAQLEQQATQAHLGKTPGRIPGFNVAESRSICLPLATPRAQGLKQSGGPYGEPS